MVSGRRKHWLILILFFLPFSFFSFSITTSVGAELLTQNSFPIVYPTSIIFPTNSTYNSSNLTVNVTAQILFKLSEVNITMTCSVDGKNVSTIPVKEIPENRPVTVTYANGTTEVIQGEPPFVPARVGGWATLPELSEGSHTITIYAQYEYWNGEKEFTGSDIQSVHFTINDGVAPRITCFSPKNQTHLQDNVHLNFTTDEPTSWMGYSLDEETNVTLTGSTTALTRLSDGLHTLIIYANDTAGNMRTSGKISFNVSQPPTPISNPSNLPSQRSISASQEPTAFIQKTQSVNPAYYIIVGMIVAVVLTTIAIVFIIPRKRLSLLRKTSEYGNR